MIGSVSTSRRAHAFAQALSEHEHGREPHGSATDSSATHGAAGDGTTGDRARGDGAAGDAPEQATLLTLADGLRTLPRPELDPEVKSVQRAQLIAAMETAFAGAASAPGERTAAIPEQRRAPRARRAARARRGAHRAPPLSVLSRLRPRTRLGKGLAAGGLSVGVAASALGGAAVASTDALPGDTLYGLKRGIEGLRLDLASGDADRGKLYLENASTRLREARRLMERGRSGALDYESVGEVRRALSGMKHDAAEGHRLLSAAYERDGKIARMKSLSSFAEEHRTRWGQLRDRLPGQLSEVGAEVSSVFDAIEQEVGPLRPLFAAPPEDPGSGGTPGTRERESAEDTTPSPSAPASPSAPSESAERTEGGADSPHPSETGPSQEGLLGESGLLDPPAEPSDKRARPSDSSGASQSPGPDVTVPPLVPGVLSELGVRAPEE